VTAPDLSIVIPAFDEEHRIGPFLASVTDWVAGRAAGGESVEVVVVDDGSTDRTLAVVCRFADRLPALVVVELPRNRGKGAAVRAGLAAASGRQRAFLDADGSTPVTELDHLRRAADEHPGAVVIGSIGVPGASVCNDQLWVRRLAGTLGARLIAATTLPGVRDPQRGCKLLPADVCDAVLPHCRTDGWAVDVELLAVARHLGFAVVEVPVSWHHVDGTKVRLRSYPATLAEVLRIRRRVRALPVRASTSRWSWRWPRPGRGGEPRHQQASRGGGFHPRVVVEDHDRPL
jgi:dolichyl-phosphate beta-glucosyltransferase